jgi:hypothetical protein
MFFIAATRSASGLSSPDVADSFCALAKPIDALANRNNTETAQMQIALAGTIFLIKRLQLFGLAGLSFMVRLGMVPSPHYGFFVWQVSRVFSASADSAR